MFSHAMRALPDGRSCTRVLVLAPILALLVLLVLPSGSAFARSPAQAKQSLQPSRPLAPATTISLNQGIGAISYNNMLYSFAIGSDNHLWADIWNGYTWHWSDLGVSPGNTKVGAVSYNNNLYVFLVGYDGHLWVDYWNRSTWGWYDQGVPPGGLTAMDGVGAVSSGNYLYVFVLGSDRHLWVDLWNSSSWGWYDQGTPPHWLLNAGDEAVISGNQISVFVQSVSDSVWLDQWNGSSWQWISLGSPPLSGGSADICGGAGAVTYNGTVDAFFGDCSGYDHLWVDQWNGSSWQWYDQGRPPGVSYQRGAGAISSGISLYVFLVATDWHLWVDYWNGSSWQWSNLGTPA